MQKKIVVLSILTIISITSCKEKETKSKSEEKQEIKVQELSYHEKYMKEIKAIQPQSPKDSTSKKMIFIQGGEFLMGGTSEQARQDEYPVHSETVGDFYMDETEVTNDEFAAFVKATGYVTTAERPIDANHIAKIANVDPSTIDVTPAALVFTGNPQMWWEIKKGADWKHPRGPESNIENKGNLPVVQVSWYDAMAYARWKGKRLPTEEEFEYAARNGGKRVKYNWGDDFKSAVKYVNFHQGTFPSKNLGEDKFLGLAPIKSFKPSKLGLYDIGGNVWEWTLNSYFEDGYHKKVNEGKVIREEDTSPWQRKVIRGGSFLCNESYCSGYRVAARMNSSPDSGLEHLGFRCVKSLNNKK